MSAPSWTRGIRLLGWAPKKQPHASLPELSFLHGLDLQEAGVKRNTWKNYTSDAEGGPAVLCGGV